MTLQHLLLRKIRKIVFLMITSTACSISFGQICPLNTPEFPFTTDYDDYGWSSGLYNSSQIGGAQTMTSVSFRIDNDDSWGNYTYNDIRVYVRHTTVNNFASDPGYPGTSGFTQVYSGNMTFNGAGMYTFNFNVAPSFVYNGADQLEVLFENRGNSDNTTEEPWFDRTNATAAGVFPGKVGWGSSWLGATGTSSNRQFNLALQFTNAGDICAFPLPVKLASSNLICDQSGLVINWKTSSEQNNDYFTIESSHDGEKWREFSTLKGAGNSNEEKAYEIDLPNHFRYYRLSQTDFDGTTEMLNTFTVNCSETEVFKSYPNPAADKLYLSSSENLVNTKIKMYDSRGQQQRITFSPTSKNSVEINIDHLESGVYSLRLSSIQFEKVVKVIKK